MIELQSLRRGDQIRHIITGKVHTVRRIAYASDGRASAIIATSNDDGVEASVHNQLSWERMAADGGAEMEVIYFPCGLNVEVHRLDVDGKMTPFAATVVVDSTGHVVKHYSGKGAKSRAIKFVQA